MSGARQPLRNAYLETNLDMRDGADGTGAQKQFVGAWGTSTTYALGLLACADQSALKSYIGAGGGTVSSVAVSGANGIGVSGSPITSSGTIVLSLGVITPTSVNGLTLAAASVGFTVAGGTLSKTLTVRNTMLLSGTDGSTLNIGAGGTLGSAAFTDTSAYQAADAELAAIAGLTSAADRLPYFTGLGAASLATFTAAGRALIDDVDASAQRTTLGLGTAAVANTGASSGNVPVLDGTGKISTSVLPASVLGNVQYQASWNANTNSPAIPSASGSNVGQYYIVSVAGSTSINGITDWKVGDWLVSDGTQWDKIDNTDLVTSVAGRVGAVVLTSSDVGLGAVENTALSTWAGTTAITTLGTIATGTWQGTAVAANKGGTGQASYAVGDLLYASASTTLSKLAGVATGNVLISGGVATAPSWGQVATGAIANDAVTYAKMQNMSATSRLIGRKTSGSGDPEELTISDALDFLSPAYGDILFRRSSQWAVLSAGTNGQVLTTHGAGADLTWEDATGGGVVDGQQLFDTGHLLSIDAGDRTLHDSSGNTLLDFQSGVLQATDSTVNLDWSSSLGISNINLRTAPGADPVPTDPVNPAGYIRVTISGVPSWIPYFQ